MKVYAEEKSNLLFRPDRKKEKVCIEKGERERERRVSRSKSLFKRSRIWM
jgi:hypothetical protein